MNKKDIIRFLGKDLHAKAETKNLTDELKKAEETDPNLAEDLTARIARKAAGDLVSHPKFKKTVEDMMMQAVRTEEFFDLLNEIAFNTFKDLIFGIVRKHSAGKGRKG